jgi:hypothetical protein
MPSESKNDDATPEESKDDDVEFDQLPPVLSAFLEFSYSTDLQGKTEAFIADYAERAGFKDKTALEESGEGHPHEWMSLHGEFLETVDKELSEFCKEHSMDPRDLFELLEEFTEKSKDVADAVPGFVKLTTYVGASEASEKKVLFCGRSGSQEGLEGAPAKQHTVLVGASSTAGASEAAYRRREHHPNRARVWGARAKGFTGGVSPRQPPHARFRSCGGSSSAAEAGKRWGWRGRERSEREEGSLLRLNRASDGAFEGRPPEPPPYSRRGWGSEAGGKRRRSESARGANLRGERSCEGANASVCGSP